MSIHALGDKMLLRLTPPFSIAFIWVVQAVLLLNNQISFLNYHAIEECSRTLPAKHFQRLSIFQINIVLHGASYLTFEDLWIQCGTVIGMQVFRYIDGIFSKISFTVGQNLQPIYREFCYNLNLV